MSGSSKIFLHLETMPTVISRCSLNLRIWLSLIRFIPQLPHILHKCIFNGSAENKIYAFGFAFSPKLSFLTEISTFCSCLYYWHPSIWSILSLNKPLIFYMPTRFNWKFPAWSFQKQETLFKVSRYIGLVQFTLIFLQCVLHLHCEI